VGRFLASIFLVGIRLDETKPLMSRKGGTEQPRGGGGGQNRRVCRRQTGRVAARGEVSDDEIFQVLDIKL
jgi:hypothetical protein